MPRRFTTIADLPGQLAVFPLVGAILLPRASLPLNIFEPRYLRLFDDAMSGNRLVGMIQPAGEGGPTGSPQDNAAPLQEIGCAGRITTYQEHDDATRLTIVLTGVSRFKCLSDSHGATPYRIADVDFAAFADDLEPGKGEDDVDRDRLLDTLQRYLAQRNLRADWNAIKRTGSEQLINWLSVASPFGAAEKQALIEARTLRERAEALVTLAEMELAAGGSDGGGRVQ